MGNIVPGVPFEVRKSPNHGDPRTKTLGVFLHSTHGPITRKASESLEDWYEREYLANLAYMVKTKTEGNTSQVSPTFVVGPHKVCRLVDDALDPWCQRYPANDLYLAIEIAKPAAAASAKLPFLDFQYSAIADLLARWKLEYPQIPFAHVTSIGAPGLIGHKDVQKGKWDPDDSFDWGRCLRESEAKYKALTAAEPKPTYDEAYDLVGSGLREWLLKHPEVGKPRFKSFFDSLGTECVWATPTTQYPDGPLVIWRKWAANEGVDPVAIATWKGKLP